MKLLVLNVNENSELLQELRREYVKDTFAGYVENMLSRLICEFDLDDNLVFTSGLSGDLYKNILFVVDKILLDNIFKYIVCKNVNNFINLVNNNIFHMDVYINHFYTRQLIEVIEKHLNFNDEEKDSVEAIIRYKLQEIIHNFYTYNTRFVNPVLMRLFDSLYDSVGHINFNYYKFELDQYNRPMIFYTEKGVHESFYNQ